MAPPGGEAGLDAIAEQGARAGVLDLEKLTAADVASLEPEVVGAAGLLSPSTGIVDGGAEIKPHFLEATTWIVREPVGRRAAAGAAWIIRGEDKRERLPRGCVLEESHPFNRWCRLG